MSGSYCDDGSRNKLDRSGIYNNKLSFVFRWNHLFAGIDTRGSSRASHTEEISRKVNREVGVAGIVFAGKKFFQKADTFSCAEFVEIEFFPYFQNRKPNAVNGKELNGESKPVSRTLDKRGKYGIRTDENKAKHGRAENESENEIHIKTIRRRGIFM